jgi:type I restriction enzyme, S subunit
MNEGREGYKKTKMGWIPVEWKISGMESVVEEGFNITYGVVQPGKEDKNGIAFIRGGDIKGGKISSDLRTISNEISNQYKRTILHGGEIIVSLVGFPGESAIVPNSLTGANIARQVGLLKINNTISTDYIQQYLSSEIGRKSLLKDLVGSAQQVINLNSLKKVLVAIPPLKEQQKIASILSTVDKKIESIDKRIEETEKLKRGLMQTLLTKGIGHTEFKDSKIGRIPKVWSVRPLIETTDKKDRYSFTGGPFGSNLKSEHYTEEGIRVIQLQNIGDGEFLNDHFIYTSEEKADELKSCNIYPKEIIIAKMADPLARACKMPEGQKRYLMCSDGIRLKIDSEKYDNDFILFTINSKYFRKNAEKAGTGTTRLRIGLSSLKNLPLAIPPLQEQQKIASILSTTDEKLQVLQEKKGLFNTLKKGLMQQLLTGQMRVKL